MIKQLRSATDTVRLVQLTDCHLGAEPGTTLLGLDTDYSLQRVMASVQQNHPEFDAVLATGDLSDHGAPTAYERLLGYFNGFCEQHYWLPGNHDDKANMQAAGAEAGVFAHTIEAGAWVIAMLDSQIPGEVGGTLGSEQLAFLQDVLERADQQNQYVLVCLHHQPIAVGCAWLDEQMVSDADAFLALVDSHACVRGVLWGHVHQQIDVQRADMKFMASPSTCVQFAPNSEDFAADTLAPGYRWLELGPNGDIATGVQRVEGETFNVDTKSGGYL